MENRIISSRFLLSSSASLAIAPRLSAKVLALIEMHRSSEVGMATQIKSMPAWTPSTLSVSSTPHVNQRVQAIVTDSDRASAGKQTSSFSSLARQLSGGAIRAERRDSQLSRAELAQHAASVIEKVVLDSYRNNKAVHDVEIPVNHDPELLLRARQATAYVNDYPTGGKTARNPFAGLSREQLAVIIYDDAGDFTVNERHAAWSEAYDQELAWRKMVVAKSGVELQSTGKLTQFFKDVLSHFQNLPLIEKAQYPEDYESGLIADIKLDFNYRDHRASGGTENYSFRYLEWLDFIRNDLTKKSCSSEDIELST